MLLQKNIHENGCLFIILFLPMWADFHEKLVVFLFEHVCAVALNTVLTI